MALSKANRTKYDKLADELDRVKENIKQATARKVEIEDILKSALPAGEATNLGTMTVTVVETRTLDNAKIEKTFPVEKFPDYYKVAVDTQAVKADIAANKLAAFQKVSISTRVSRNDG